MLGLFLARISRPLPLWSKSQLWSCAAVPGEWLTAGFTPCRLHVSGIRGSLYGGLCGNQTWQKTHINNDDNNNNNNNNNNKWKERGGFSSMPGWMTVAKADIMIHKEFDQSQKKQKAAILCWWKYVERPDTVYGCTHPKTLSWFQENPRSNSLSTYQKPVKLKLWPFSTRKLTLLGVPQDLRNLSPGSRASACRHLPQKV